MKKLIPTISKGSLIIFKKYNEHLIGFVEMDEFSLMGFKVEVDDDDKFVDWLGDDRVAIDMDEFVKLRQITKTSIDGLEENPNKFAIKIYRTNKDEEVIFDDYLTFEKKKYDSKKDKYLDRIISSTQKEEREHQLKLSSNDLLETERFNLYIKDGEISEEESDTVLINSYIKSLSLMRKNRDIIVESDLNPTETGEVEILIKAIEKEIRYFQIINVITFNN